MTNSPIAIVAGDQKLATVLRGTGLFEEVRAADTTEALEEAGIAAGSAELVYVFAPGFTDSTVDGGAAGLASWLAAAGHRVVVHSGIGDLRRLSPSVVILNWPANIPILVAALAPGSTGTAGPAFPAEQGTHSDGDAGPDRGLVVVVAAPTGGTGKSTLAVNLAAFGAKKLHPAGRPVAVVDFNLQQPDVGRLLGADSPSILDLVGDPGAVDPESIGRFLSHLPDIGLSALLGSPSPEQALPSVLSPELCRGLLRTLRVVFPYVVVDTPVAEFHHRLFSDAVLPEADALVVPVAPNLIALEKTLAWLDAITAPHHAGGGAFPAQRVTLVHNRARLGVACDPEQVQSVMAGWRFAGMIPEHERWPRAANTGQLPGLNGDPRVDAVLSGIWHHATADPLFATSRPERRRRFGRRARAAIPPTA